MCWEHHSKSCVSGQNIRNIPDQTIDECKELCNAEPTCKAFEYGVSHGGRNKRFKPRDCHLQSGNNPVGCDGIYWNLDLYIKYNGCHNGKMKT